LEANQTEQETHRLSGRFALLREGQLVQLVAARVLVETSTQQAVQGSLQMAVVALQVCGATGALAEALVSRVEAAQVEAVAVTPYTAEALD
jgi:hypothetical protein